MLKPSANVVPSTYAGPAAYLPLLLAVEQFRIGHDAPQGRRRTFDGPLADGERVGEAIDNLAVFDLLVAAEDAVELVAADLAGGPHRAGAADVAGAGHLAEDLVGPIAFLRDVDDRLELLVGRANERRHRFHPHRHRGDAFDGNGGVDQLVQRGLLDVRHDSRAPRPAGAAVVEVELDGRRVAGRQALAGVEVVVQRQADLLEIVAALRSPRGLARRLDGGQEQGDEHADDRDDHQQLDERKADGAAIGVTHEGNPRVRREEIPGSCSLGCRCRDENLLRKTLRAARKGRRRAGECQSELGPV